MKNSSNRPRTGRILVVDDEESLRNLVRRILIGAGFDVDLAHSGQDALDALAQEDFDLLVSDIVMPGMSGHELVGTLRLSKPDLPIVVVTGQNDLDTAMATLRAGAAGMVLKPFSAKELLGEVERVLDVARVVRDAYSFRIVSPLLDGVALALSAAIEARNLETGEHCRQLGYLGERVALALELEESQRTAIRIGGFLHDVGKIAIADAILLKPGRLTEEEYTQMKRHADIGGDMLAVHRDLVAIAEIVRHHHERFDGAGYPAGLKGDGIPLGARIISVADTFSAMTTTRPYRAALPVERALDELSRYAGSQFDPEIVSVFINCWADETIPTPLNASI